MVSKKKIKLEKQIKSLLPQALLFFIKHSIWHYRTENLKLLNNLKSNYQDKTILLFWSIKGHLVFLHKNILFLI